MTPTRQVLHILAKGHRLGGHVHVGIWAGTELQAQNQARPKLGKLVMDAEQWEAFKSMAIAIRFDESDDRQPDPGPTITDTGVAPAYKTSPPAPTHGPTEDKLVDLMANLEHARTARAPHAYVGDRDHCELCSAPRGALRHHTDFACRRAAAFGHDCPTGCTCACHDPSTSATSPTTPNHTEGP